MGPSVRAEGLEAIEPPGHWHQKEDDGAEGATPPSHRVAADGQPSAQNHLARQHQPKARLI